MGRSIKHNKRIGDGIISHKRQEKVKEAKERCKYKRRLRSRLKLIKQSRNTEK